MAVTLGMTVAANAQTYLGGGFSFGNNDKGTSISILPEVGYAFNENWTVGGTLSFTHVKIKMDGADNSYSAFGIAPYVRWTFANAGPVNLFLDGGLAFYSISDTADKKYSPFEIGITPGIAIPVSDRFSFVGHVGFLGYRDNDSTSLFDNEGFGMGLSGDDFSVGIYYNF